MSTSEATTGNHTATPTLSQVSLHATAPRSALRHRPINTDTSQKTAPQVTRASRTQKIAQPQADVIDQEESTLLPETTPPPVTSSVSKKRSARPHWLLLVGLGMVLTLLAMFATQSLHGRVTTMWNDIQYGHPRTFQIDAFVGHEPGETPSHFIVTNLHGQIHIIQLLGGDPSQIRTFTGPQLVGADAELIPATIRFVDTRDDGYPDMYLQAGNIQVIYQNVDGTFKPV